MSFQVHEILGPCPPSIDLTSGTQGSVLYINQKSVIATSLPQVGLDSWHDRVFWIPWHMKL